MSTGRVIDLGLHLLDRQIVDTDGQPVGNVDDVVISDDGYVVAMEVGPQALAARLGGALGRWLAFWSHALSRSSTDRPGRIGMELVTDLGTAVTVARSRRDLGVQRNEDRVRELFIGRIPGADHSPGSGE